MKPVPYFILKEQEKLKNMKTGDKDHELHEIWLENRNPFRILDFKATKFQNKHGMNPLLEKLDILIKSNEVKEIIQTLDPKNSKDEFAKLKYALEQPDFLIPSQEYRAFIWKYRYWISWERPDAIVKFLCIVNWNEDEDAWEAIDLIDRFDNLKYE